MIDREFWHKLIEQKGVSVTQACRVMNINRSQMYDNRGTRSCYTDTLEKLADFLGVTTDYLLRRKSPAEKLANAELTSKNIEIELLRSQIKLLNDLVSEKERRIVSLMKSSQNNDSE